MSHAPRLKRAAYGRVDDLREALTPKIDDLSPQGDFQAFRERLRGIEAFAPLAEQLCRRLAVDLNHLMRTFADTPEPVAVAAELDEIALLAKRLASAITGAHGVTLAALTRTEEMFPPYLMTPRGAERTEARSADDPLVRAAFGPELAVAGDIQKARNRTRSIRRL